VFGLLLFVLVMLVFSLPLLVCRMQADAVSCDKAVCVCFAWTSHTGAAINTTALALFLAHPGRNQTVPAAKVINTSKPADQH
jgi:hypothetical protein